jgi:DNA repair protein RecO (recombination protein O)
VELTPAFVLHHRPYRETSLLVDVFSEHHGFVTLVARGARQQRKRHHNRFQPFQPLLLSWHGRGELVTLSQVELTEPAYRLAGKASLCGLYLNELLVRLLPRHEPEQQVFDAYCTALVGLQRGEDERIVLRLFEKRLLGYLGYGLLLDLEAESHRPIRDETAYVYHPDSGPWPAAGTGSENVVSGRSLRHLNEEAGFDEISLREIKHLMRTVINYYLGGRPLRSRELFAQLSQFNSQP